MAIRITGTLLAAPEPAFPLPMAFYGSLMRGSGGADELGIGLRFVSACEIPGQLIDLGDYPGLLTGPGRVLGELFEVLEPEALAQLDRFEGFDPADRQGPLYLREAVPATGLP